jgi:hypothetical protein
MVGDELLALDGVGGRSQHEAAKLAMGALGHPRTTLGSGLERRLGFSHDYRDNLRY